ncbi:dihydrofolate reductase [Serratia marcescens]|uniref:dihydrofolate reductase family protein n=1 Tax=Serratia TaxID=613 RepID=UPI00083E7E61|nr:MULTISPECIES: dihydrofolate reductase family protein [Serratia]KAB5492742.1 dihydrofolate reductase family protein [Enterobacter sp. RJAL6]ASM02265.1 dihydrofolate reductase [Serratia marcescens]AUO04437.1 dihydrofolate reductase [Serratia marcescens]MBH2553506.1 dihydrofolate reductase family protein [Serratia ureilytica]MBH2559804.1 dihydrofolate reductase family protein [Serratia ureilytica]
MRQIIASAFVSLDGVMQAPGGQDEDRSGGFRFGGWTAPYWDDAVAETMGELFSAPFDLLLGRRTYDIFAGYWPHITDEADPFSADIARVFNQAAKYVATHHGETLTWEKSQWLGQDILARLRELKRTQGPVLLVQGSSTLMQQLLANDLVDELRLLTYPVLLGGGKRLFDDNAAPAAFTLTHSVVSPGGVIVAHYRRAGAVKTGSFVAESAAAAQS